MIQRIRQPREFSPEIQLRLASMIVLNEMLRHKLSLALPLSGKNVWLKDHVAWLMERGLVETRTRDNARRLIATAAGRGAYRNFQLRYIEYLNVVEIFGAVDLQNLEFALTSYYHLNDTEWEEFIEDDRWDDLRTAIAEHKNICPFETVFFEFFHERAFFHKDDGKAFWQKELAQGPLWGEIRDIVERSLAADDLSYDDNGDYIDGDDVLESIIVEGVKAGIDLWEEERNLVEEGSLMPPDYSISPRFFEPYLDPGYRSPAWDTEME